MTGALHVPRDKATACTMWDHFAMNRVGFISDARRQMENSRSRDQSTADCIRATRHAIERSIALIDRCSGDVNTRGRYRAAPTQRPLPTLIGFDTVINDRHYAASYATVTSGHPDSHFITIYSAYGERSAWISGIDPAEAARIILSKLIIASGVDDRFLP